MKTLCGFQCAYALLLSLAVVAPCRALESTQIVDEASVNAIATNAFHVLKNVPSVGLEKSLPGLDQIIETHRRLSRETGVSQRQLSLVLADAVAYAIVTEVRISELARMGAGQSNAVKNVPFDKKTVTRLWKANVPDFAHLIRMALKGRDIVTSYVSEHSSEEEVLSGRMIHKTSGGQISTRILELNQRAELPVYGTKSPSPDEQLMYALNKCQAFQDLAVVIDLYAKGDLPAESALLRTAIDQVLAQYPKRRVDDGMESSAFKVWLTYRHFYPKADTASSIGFAEEYCLRQALVLAPFMTDTSALPETAKKALARMDRSRVSGSTSTSDK